MLLLYFCKVRICTQTDCLPLAENQYKPIIGDNYYALRHFWFELDHAQVEKLLTLFASRPVSAAFKRVSGVHTNLRPLQKLDLTFSDQHCGDTNSKMTSWADMVEAEESHAVTNFSEDVLNDTNWPPLNGENLSDMESNHSWAYGSYMRDGTEEETEHRKLMLGEDENGNEKALILQKLKDIVAHRDISSLSLKDTPDADIVPGAAEDTTPLEILASEAGNMSQLEYASPISVCQVDFQFKKAIT